MTRIMWMIVMLLSVMSMTIGGCIKVERSGDEDPQPEYRYEADSY